MTWGSGGRQGNSWKSGNVQVKAGCQGEGETKAFLSFD